MGRLLVWSDVAHNLVYIETKENENGWNEEGLNLDVALSAGHDDPCNKDEVHLFSKILRKVHIYEVYAVIKLRNKLG